METKYLSDGRKVAVIGQLNNVESIVQEIFVSEQGDEIPSGERFTVKSLHDTPVKSWKEKEQDRLEQRIADSKLKEKQAEKELRDITFKLSGKKAQAKQALEHINQLINNPEVLDTFASFLSGNIKWLAEKSPYKLKAPERFDENAYVREGYGWGDNKGFEAVKLVSIFGKASGDIGYKRNQYQDGSGSGCEIVPFENYEDALSYVYEQAKEKVANGVLRAEELDVCRELGFTFTKDELAASMKRAAEHAENNVRNCKETLAKAEKTKTDAIEKFLA